MACQPVNIDFLQGARQGHRHIHTQKPFQSARERNDYLETGTGAGEQRRRQEEETDPVPTLTCKKEHPRASLSRFPRSEAKMGTEAEVV
jgi:hypothetical protein